MMGTMLTWPTRRRSRQGGWRRSVIVEAPRAARTLRTRLMRDMERQPWPERPSITDDRSEPRSFQGPVHPFGSLATTVVNPLRNPTEAHGFASRSFDRFAFSRMNSVQPLSNPRSGTGACQTDA